MIFEAPLFKGGCCDMKRCERCGARYTDDTLLYCLKCGGNLIPCNGPDPPPLKGILFAVIGVLLVAVIVLTTVLIGEKESLRTPEVSPTSGSSSGPVSEVPVSPNLTIDLPETEKPSDPPVSSSPSPEMPSFRKTPGPDDLLGCNKLIVHPMDSSWLSDYETMYVKTKYGVRAYLRYKPTKDSGHYSSVYEEEAVTVLARENGFTLVRTAAGEVGWVTSSVLVYSYD